MTGLVERPLLGNGHGGCGRRLGETHRWKHRQGAPGRPHGCVPSAPRMRSSAAHHHGRRGRDPPPGVTPRSRTAAPGVLHAVLQASWLASTSAPRTYPGPAAESGRCCRSPGRSCAQPRHSCRRGHKTAHRPDPGAAAAVPPRHARPPPGCPRPPPSPRAQTPPPPGPGHRAPSATRDWPGRAARGTRAGRPSPATRRGAAGRAPCPDAPAPAATCFGPRRQRQLPAGEKTRHARTRPW